MCSVGQQAEPQLLLAGDGYTAYDIPEGVEGDWHVLFRHEGTFLLAELPVEIDSTHDACLDDGPDQMSGRRIVVGGVPSPVFMVRGVPGLRPGPVEVAEYTRSDYNLADTVTIRFSGTELSLRGVLEGDGYHLDLVSGSRVDRLFEAEWTDEGWWGLSWAGDLNRDGIVDLLLEATHKYSVHPTRLFLSGWEQAGALPVEVAVFTVTAC